MKSAFGLFHTCSYLSLFPCWGITDRVLV